MQTNEIISEDEQKIWFLSERILDLKLGKNAIILAHFYQEPVIQEIADFVGDSLELSKKAAETDARIIVFAGVRFMAETAKILNPGKKVLIPDPGASCSLSDSCSISDFDEFVKHYPDHVIVSYINTSADIKAKSDYICTSSNAESVINSIPESSPILFLPDRNLGEYLIRKTGREMVLWDGVCSVHEAFSMDKILELHRRYPHAKFIAHPESSPRLLEIADFIGSTSALLDYVIRDSCDQFIVGTEIGILHQMKSHVPEKLLIPAPSDEDNACACSQCEFMKINTLEKIYQSLKLEIHEVVLPEEIMDNALKPLSGMINMNSNTNEKNLTSNF